MGSCNDNIQNKKIYMQKATQMGSTLLVVLDEQGSTFSVDIGDLLLCS